MNKKHTFSTCFFIKKSNDKTVDPLIYLRITVDGKREEVSSKHRINKEKWNSKKGRVSGFSENAKTINQTLEAFETKAKQCYNQLISKNKLISAQAIKNHVIGAGQREHTLITSFEKHCEKIKLLVGSQYTKSTYVGARATLKHLNGYLKSNYNLKDISISELNYDFIADFEIYLKTTPQKDGRVCKTNGAIKHINRLKGIIQEAIKKDWIEKDPFINFNLKKDKTKREYLTIDELELIEKKKFALPRLDIVKDVFLFSCYTGLSYIDIKSLTTENIRIGIDGEKWIFTARQKTGGTSNIPLLPKALEILEKYKNDIISLSKSRLLPVLSNQKMNAYLKEIGDLCGITKNLTCHMGRHTFATTITLSNDVPIETVSKMLGHSDLKTTQIYGKILENKVSNDMIKLKEKLKAKTDNDSIKSA